MLSKCKQLFDSRNTNELSYIHWKSNQHLMEGLDGDTDLDVLLSTIDKESGCRILKKIGFVQFKSQFGSRYPNVEDWIGMDEVEGKLIHLHLHYALMTGHKGMKEYQLPWLEDSLQTRVRDVETGVYIMNPNLELVSLYSRLILKSSNSCLKAAKKGSYKIDKHFLVEIEYIKKRVEWDKIIEIARRYYGNNSDEFVVIIKSEVLSPEQFLRLYSIVTSTMRRYSRYHGLSLAFRRIFYSVVLPLRLKISRRSRYNIITHKVANPKRGLTIAFVGQDGSGKSTVTKSIEKWLTWKIEAKCFYLGSGEVYYLPWQKRVLKRFNQGNTSFHKLIRAWLLLSYYLASAKYVLRTIRNANKYASRGGIALFDRYPQTVFPGINDGPKIKSRLLDRIPSNLRWVALAYARKEEKLLNQAVSTAPSHVFKLVLSAEESIRRKPTEDQNAIIRKHEIVMALKFPLSQVLDVDAEQPYKSELLKIKNTIWQAIAEL